MAANSVFKNIVDKGTKLMLCTPQNMQGNILVIKSKGWTRFAKVPSSSKIL
jgi:hypothetical protein